jgi:hypothetical protein
MIYLVIDTDASMNYPPGDEVIATVDATCPSEAIDKAMNAIGIDVLKSYDVDQYELYVLRHIDAVPKHLYPA